MRELTIIEKARAYDEALKKSEDIKAGKCQKTFVSSEDMFGYLFPELAWSEDEKVRKELLSFFIERAKHTEDSTFNGLSSKEIIAWLEKQGENISQHNFTFDDVLALQNAMALSKKEDKDLYKQLESLHDRVHDAYWLEKQGEQKPWSEEDEERLSSIIESYKVLLRDYKACHDVDYIPYNSNTVRSVVDDVNFLKSLKDRVGSEANCTTTKEWSEEDIVAIDSAVEALSKDLPSLAASIRRLKQLSPQYDWKPSDEQMDALLYILRHYTPAATDELALEALQTLELMLEQLKKLREA